MRIETPIIAGQVMPDLAGQFVPEIGAAALAFSQAGYRHSALPLRLFEAARIATAAINGCTVCRNWRSARDLEFFGVHGGVSDHGPVPDEAFYQAVLAGDLSALSPAERIATVYVQRMGTDPQGLASDEPFWSEVKTYLTDGQIVDLTYCAAAWIGLGRAVHVLGIDTACTIPTHRVAEAA